jgi:hypothetical protein
MQYSLPYLPCILDKSLRKIATASTEINVFVLFDCCSA